MTTDAVGWCCLPVTFQIWESTSDMRKSVKSRAEEKFAATLKKDKEALEEREVAEQKLVDRMAKQRALRLEKEAELEKVAEKPKKK